MQWIMSEGGPLICIEAVLATSWGGIDRLSVSSKVAKNDYDRACQSHSYTYAVPVRQGIALLLGMGPLDTSFWLTPSGAPCIVQVECAEPDIDEPILLGKIDESIFNAPLQVTDATFASGLLVLFDSAEPGDEPDKKSISFSIKPGNYRVLTQTFEVQDQAAFILHKFHLTI